MIHNNTKRYFRVDNENHCITLNQAKYYTIYTYLHQWVTEGQPCSKNKNAKNKYQLYINSEDLDAP